MALHVMWCGYNDFFHPLTLAIDIAIATVVSGLVGLFASQFARIQRGPRAVFVAATLAFAAANVLLIHYGSPRFDAISDSTMRHFFAPYRYYVMLVPALLLTLTGFTWSLVTARRRRSQPPAVTQ